MRDKKLPPELQKLMEDEAEKDAPNKTGLGSVAQKYWKMGFVVCYQAMQAQAAKGFDENEALKEAQQRFLSFGVEDIHKAASARIEFVDACKWQHSRDFAAMQAKDNRIAELEKRQSELHHKIGKLIGAVEGIFLKNSIFQGDYDTWNKLVDEVTEQGKGESHE